MRQQCAILGIALLVASFPPSLAAPAETAPRFPSRNVSPRIDRRLGFRYDGQCRTHSPHRMQVSGSITKP
jgi:hypothetical protein